MHETGPLQGPAAGAGRTPGGNPYRTADRKRRTSVAASNDPRLGPNTEGTLAGAAVAVVHNQGRDAGTFCAGALTLRWRQSSPRSCAEPDDLVSAP